MPNVGLFVGFNLPVYRKKIAAGVCEAQARALADAKLYEAERDDDLPRDQGPAHAGQGPAEHPRPAPRAASCPRPGRRSSSPRATTPAGNVDYVTLITAWREVLQIQLQIAQVEAELGKALASLERAVGVPDQRAPAGSPSQPAATPLPPPPAAEGSPFERLTEPNRRSEPISPTASTSRRSLGAERACGTDSRTPAPDRDA